MSKISSCSTFEGCSIASYDGSTLQALRIDRRDLLGGLIHEYERAAA
jgi:hypothetical protein